MGPLGLFTAGLPPEVMQPFMLGMPGAGALASPGGMQPPAGGDAGAQMAAQMQQYAQQLQGQLALMKGQQVLPGQGGAGGGAPPVAGVAPPSPTAAAAAV